MMRQESALKPEAKTVRLDIGCGQKKQNGFLGIDVYPYDAVDYVLDLEKDRIPLDDNSVSKIYSSHFLEHVKNPVNVLMEIARVARDNALFELWTPYASCNTALFYLHERYYTEEIWRHHFIVWDRFCKARWQMHDIHFIIPKEVVALMQAQGVSLDFALRFYRNIATEFKVAVRIRKDQTVKPTMPSITYATCREEKPVLLPHYQKWFRESFQVEKLVDLVLTHSGIEDRSKRIYVWGTGSFSRVVSGWLEKKKLCIAGYFDGLKHDDDRLKPRLAENARVIVATKQQEEVLVRLRGLGYAETDIISFY